MDFFRELHENRYLRQELAKAGVENEQLRKVQELLWSAEAEYKCKRGTGAVGRALTWEELADFMWDQIREALEVLERGETGNGGE